MLVPLSPQPVADDELARRKGLAAHRALRFKGTCTYNAVPAEDMAARRGRWKRPRREAEYARRHMRAEERGRREERGEREEDREDKVKTEKTRCVRARERERGRERKRAGSVSHACNPEYNHTTTTTTTTITPTHLLPLPFAAAAAVAPASRARSSFPAVGTRSSIGSASTALTPPAAASRARRRRVCAAAIHPTAPRLVERASWRTASTPRMR